MSLKSTFNTPAARIVPINKITIEITSGLLGNLLWRAQSISRPIHVNWNHMTTAREAGRYFKDSPYTIPVVPVKIPAHIKISKPFLDGLGNFLSVKIKMDITSKKPIIYWLDTASAEVKPCCIATLIIVDKIP